MPRKRVPTGFGFVRSKNNNFLDLENYSESAPIEVNNENIRYVSRKKQTNDLIKKVGDYFEFLNRGIYGGNLRKRYNLNGIVIEPDLVSKDEKNIWESKCFHSGDYLKIPDIQLTKLTYLQKKLQEKHNSEYPQVSYEIYKHRILELFKRFKEGPTKGLVKEVSENIWNLVSLPLSVVEKIHRNDLETELVSRYDGNLWKDNYTRIKSGLLNSFIANPEDTLGFIGLSPEDYSIEKRKFPQGIKISGNEIRPFPILVIKDKGHETWAREFMENQGAEYVKRFEELEKDQIEMEYSEEDLPDWLRPKEEEVPF